VPQSATLKVMTNAVFDKQEQYDRVASGLLPGEEVFVVYDAIGSGTGFIGLTSLRVILQDNSFVGKRVALTSIPYNRIHSVSFVADKSMFGRLASTSEIAIAVGGHTHEVQFRGEDKAKAVHDAILSRMLGV
jgi:hypothetical protein